MYKCKNFIAIQGYINNIPIDIININNDDNITCEHNHTLILINGTKRKKHLRHKYKNDTEMGYKMTKWHYEWQHNFNDIEIEFKNKKQRKNRRCDILLNDYVIEIQHSPQCKKEVDDRYHDYKTINNKNMIWILDGENSIVENINGRIIIEINDQWKNDNYITFDFIFMDINKVIYKIYTRYIKNKMIDCNEIYQKDEFIYLLKNNITKVLDINKPKQCNLYIRQQGAGSGKTHGIVQYIDKNEHNHDTYIIITKQHTAKFNIYKEFEEQYKKGDIENLEGYKSKSDTNNKKYIIEFTKNNNKKKIIIGTIDSFFWSISNKHIDSDVSNLFEKMVEEVFKGIINKKNINNITYFNQNVVYLNKKLCIIIDETQDLSVIYKEAIYKMMKTRYIDFYLVGDLLQSISNVDNAFYHLLKLNDKLINVEKLEYTNNIRRFKDETLIKFVNHMVDFNKHELPIMRSDDPTDIPDSLIIRAVNHRKEIINEKGEDISDEYHTNYISDEIMKIYIKEIENSNGNIEKEDILIISPLVANNKVMVEVETRINEYWNEKLVPDTYTQHAIFHKSEIGSSIDLKLSTKSTRLMSIHASKGLGHKIVIVFGLCDYNLFFFSKNKRNLVFDSMVHVAITRMKEKLYVLFENNGDSISKKIINFSNTNNLNPIMKPHLSLSIKINLKYISQYHSKNDFSFDNNDLPVKDLLDTDIDKKMIEMSHHNIRYSVMKSQMYLNILKYGNNTDPKDQFKTILRKISKSSAEKVYNWKAYINLVGIPIYQVINKKLTNDNKNYNRILKNNIRHVLKMIKININNITKLSFCSFELIIFRYIIEIWDRPKRFYSMISPNEIFNIIDAYNKSFVHESNNHNNCLCKHLFKNNNHHESNKLEKYICKDHYEMTNILDEQFQSFINKNKITKWQFNHKLTLGIINEYEIDNYFEFIGLNDKDVFILEVKPQLNSLNYIDTMISLYFQQYLLENIKEHNDINDKYNSIMENSIKFSKKTIRPVVFSLNNNKCIYTNFTDINLKDQIKSYMNYYLHRDDESVFYLFKHYYDLISSKTAKKPFDIIYKIIQCIRKDINILTYPTFLLNFLNDVLYIIENGNDVIESYINKDTFTNRYSKKIERYIERSIE